MEFVKLIKDAELKLGPLRGSGFGSILLTIIVLAVLYNFGPTPALLLDIVSSVFDSGD